MNETLITTATGQRIAEYLSNNPRAYADVPGTGDANSTVYRNQYWTGGPQSYQGRTFREWLHISTDYSETDLHMVPVMARAILAEAYEINAQRSETGNWEDALAATPRHPNEDGGVDQEIREAFPGAVIPDTQLAKLRKLVRDRNAGQKLNAELLARIESLSGDITDPSDRRVWGIFGRAAEEADKQGYCGVYDQISDAVGIPDRDELRDSGYLETPSWQVWTFVEYTYEVTTRTRVPLIVSASDEDRIRDEVSELDESDLQEAVENMDSLPEGASITNVEVDYIDYWDRHRD